jgi:hypothetical protein
MIPQYQLEAAIRTATLDLEATYDAAKTGKTIIITLGQFRRLARLQALVACLDGKEG